jgi:hypothetical protein
VKGGGAVFNSGIYQNWQEEQRASARSVEGMRPVPMVRTDEPVSPEAEAAEAVALRSLGRPVPTLAEPVEGEEILANVDIELPDRLLALVPPQGTRQLDDASWSYLGFTVPTSYQGPVQFSLQSLTLTLDLATTEQLKGQAPPGKRPVALLLHPLSEGATTVHDYGTVGVDLGQLAACFAPVIARALKLEVHLDLRTTTYNPAIQTSGAQKHECRWTVTDPGMARGFQSAVVAQSRAGERLCVIAHLHIEVRKRMFGIVHKTYGKSAIPFCYVHDPSTHTLDGFELNAAEGTLGPLGQTFVLPGSLGQDLVTSVDPLKPSQSPAEVDAELATWKLLYPSAFGAPAEGSGIPPAAGPPSAGNATQSRLVPGTQPSQAAEDSDQRTAGKASSPPSDAST